MLRIKYCIIYFVGCNISNNSEYEAGCLKKKCELHNQMLMMWYFWVFSTNDFFFFLKLAPMIYYSANSFLYYMLLCYPILWLKHLNLENITYCLILKLAWVLYLLMLLFTGLGNQRKSTCAQFSFEAFHIVYILNILAWSMRCINVNHMWRWLLHLHWD